MPIRMRLLGDSRRRLLLASMLLALLVVLAGCSFYTPNVCSTCGVAGAADEDDLNVSKTQATMTIQVHDDGSAHVRSEVALEGPDLGRMQSNRTLTNRLVRNALQTHGLTDANSSENLSASFDEDTLIVEYDVPEFGNRYPGGVVVVDDFSRQPSSRIGWEVRADRVRVVGPEGSVVANSPPNGEVDRRSVTYNEWVDDRTYIAFAPDQSYSSQVITKLALAYEVAKWAVWPALTGAFVPAFWFGTLALLSLNRTRDESPQRSTDWEDLRWPIAVASMAVFVVLGIAELPASSLNSVGTVLVLLLAPPTLFGWLGAITDASWARELAVLVAIAGTSIAVSWLFLIVGGLGPMFLTAVWTVVGTILAAPVYYLTKILAGK